MIPAEIRRRYGIKPGDEVHIVDYAGTLVVVPKLEHPVDAVFGILADDGPPLTETLMGERRRERELEDRKIAHWPQDDD